MKHELAHLAGKIDWDFIDGEIALLYSEKGRPGIETRFVIGLLLLKPQLSMMPLELLGVGVAPRHNGGALGDARIGLPQPHTMPTDGSTHDAA
jgi:hypothetical protein